MTTTVIPEPSKQTGKRKGQPLGSLDLAAIILLPFMLCAWVMSGGLLTLYQVKTQDLPILFAVLPMLLVLQRWAPAWRLPARAPRLAPVLVVGIVLVLLLGWGAYVLMYDFPVSRDEHMVVFDMAVYDKGRLAAPLAPMWRPFAQALVPAFLLNASQPIGLVSDYLPVNAMLRLAFSYLADPVFYNPLLALAGAVALLDIARRLFADDSRAIWVTLIVYTLSSQMLVNAMTAFAMTGHMALNLIWLAAFLRGGRRGHAFAIFIGLLATGLHQLAFHPLFAAPFVLWRLRQGEWRIALVYAGAYAAIIAWWIAFPILASAQTGVPAGPGPSDSRFLDKVMPLLINRDPLTGWWMMLNLLRFVAWQHLALLPLVLAAIPAARRGGLAAPMLGGIVLGLIFLAMVLPYQALGWGYRYMHPYLGCFALLAGLGYQQLAAKAPARTDGMMIVLSAVTLVAAVPSLMWKAHAFVRPQMMLDRFITTKQSDFVLVDTWMHTPTTDRAWQINAIDDVRNDPDLTNRPLRFSSRLMDPTMVATLCRRGTVSVVTEIDMRRLGFGEKVIGSGGQFNRLANVLRQGGCLRA